jgi:ribonuclease BN (tRNA processing enzyme)
MIFIGFFPLKNILFMVIIETMKAFLILLFLIIGANAAKVEIMVLGSGGPEIDERAGSSYVLWIDSEAKLLIDTGSGSMLQFEKSGAKLETLEAIALTHLHIDHVVDLPSYINAAYFTDRKEPLHIIGPAGNEYFPSTTGYCSIMFGENGAYRYMQSVLTRKSNGFEILSKDINTTAHMTFKTFSIDTASISHGTSPALAFRITAGDKSIVISGSTNNKDHTLEKFAKDADLLIVDHSIPESADEVARSMHMTPSAIAQTAQKAGVKKVLLSHRMKQTFEHENETLVVMKKIYKGQIIFAEDLMQIRP